MSRGKGYGDPGKVASHSGANECHRCGRDIEHTKDMAKVRGRWIHKWCAGGGDE